MLDNKYFAAFMRKINRLNKQAQSVLTTPIKTNLDKLNEEIQSYINPEQDDDFNAIQTRLLDEGDAELYQSEEKKQQEQAYIHGFKGTHHSKENLKASFIAIQKQLERMNAKPLHVKEYFERPAFEKPKKIDDELRGIMEKVRYASKHYRPLEQDENWRKKCMKEYRDMLKHMGFTDRDFQTGSSAEEERMERILKKHNLNRDGTQRTQQY